VPTPSTGTVRGHVLLERRASNAGVRVAVGEVSTTTEADGAYSLDGVPTGPQRLRVTHPSYLRGVVAVDVVGGAVVTAPEVTLLGGDVDQDGHIYVSDASLVGMAMESDPGAVPDYAVRDITADGVVDIRDMVAVQYNWGARASE